MQFIEITVMWNFQYLTMAKTTKNQLCVYKMPARQTNLSIGGKDLKTIVTLAVGIKEVRSRKRWKLNYSKHRRFMIW